MGRPVREGSLVGGCHASHCRRSEKNVGVQLLPQRAGPGGMGVMGRTPPTVLSPT